LVDQICPDSDLDDIVHRLDRIPLGRMLGIDLGLDPQHAVHNVIAQHSSLHLVHATAIRRDKGIFAYPQSRKQNSFAGFFGPLRSCS
jgi:hypothetical protein